MRNKFLAYLIFLIFILLAMALASRFWIGQIVPNVGIIQRPAVYLFEKMNGFRMFWDEFRRLGKVSNDNVALREKVDDLTSQLSKFKNLEEENNYLRKSLNLAEKHKFSFVDASIFSSSASLDGLNFLINKGSSDGLESGLVVVTDEGVLIGRIGDVFETFSRVVSVIDSSFKVTARDAASGAGGIAVGAVRNGLNLDLIVEDDDVREGDLIVSSGDDLFPAALIIGTVDLVETKAGELFKKVRIKPAFDQIRFSRVLIIKK
ncbi:MAG: rod shape-determining protein MreC [Candidatus Yanofskybacteria bacterium RIFOXYB1_FULL_44_29]|nr:MAG: rod shape-determining protein MreC [Candidatus Yanofskybacteria bacterium RIFOXYB1_FULL_44_29]